MLNFRERETGPNIQKYLCQGMHRAFENTEVNCKSFPLF
jgi:hypothetical protein